MTRPDVWARGSAGVKAPEQVAGTISVDDRDTHKLEIVPSEDLARPRHSSRDESLMPNDNVAQGDAPRAAREITCFAESVDTTA